MVPDHEDRAVLLREHLQLAGVTRAELFTSDATRRAITFHDLRATGITWAAVRGDDPLRIKQRAGHRSFSTTEGYIREAENLREGFGAPFPPLPADLARVSAFRRRPTRSVANFPWYGVEQRGIEPSESAEFTTLHVDSRTNDPARVDVSTRELVDVGPSEIQSARGALTVEDALAVALVRAAAAQEWAVVAQLARELEARRLIAAGVRSLVDERGRSPGRE
jgi:hypothetical protein